MDDLCFRTKAIVQKVPQDLSELERLVLSLRSNESDKTIINRKEYQIAQNLDLAISNCQRLHVLSKNEPSFKRKQIELVISQIQSECQQLRSSLQTLQRKRATHEQELMHRASLLSTPACASGMGSDGVTVVQIDTEVSEFSRLQLVSRRLDEMLLGGTASLEALKLQGYANLLDFESRF
uniref:t-SNARE coiled-coil homology domain-containing protein n=1 Tax=Mesocestoides corti TaxID=53468 RepID=A0A5K3G0B8_MESCO